MITVKISRFFIVLVTILCHSSVYAEVLKDPTRPPSHSYSAVTASGTKAAPRWVLSSTLIAPTRRSATINGKTVGLGQKIGGARVVEINPSHVALRDGDREIILELLPVDIKRAR